jgi:hypothetical protein
MKRKPKMGENILKRTGSDALAIVTGGAAAKVDTAELREPAARPSLRKERSDRTEQVQYRVTEAQRVFLVREAMKRALREGHGRIDASEVLREILDEHMERAR